MPSNGDRSNAAKWGAFGMLSGAVAWALIVLVSLINPSFESPRWNGIIFNQVSLLPGLVFGSFIGLLLNRGSGLEWRRHLGYVLAAGLAYFCAFHIAYHLFEDLNNELSSVGVSLIIAGISAGLIGSVLLGVMTMCLLRAPRRLVLRLSVLAGGAAGVLLWLAQFEQPPWAWGYLLLFALWQGAYAASLAPLLRPGPDTA